MKIKPEHYATLKEAIRTTLSQNPTSHEVYRKEGFTEMRFRWDLLWASKVGEQTISRWISDTIYEYANDEHIDTALRRIVKELEGGGA